MLVVAETEKRPLVNSDSLNLSLPLKFTTEAKSSRLFGHAPSGLFNALRTKPLTFNAHRKSVTLKLFQQIEKLNETYRIISTNYDRNGLEFISTFEGIILWLL